MSILQVCSVSMYYKLGGIIILKWDRVGWEWEIINAASTLCLVAILFLLRWLNTLLSTGAKRPLQAEDLYGLLEGEQTDTVTEILER